ncbi:MAG TPA: hypothetical protein VIB08_06120 [Thermoanaerobaculia bacterium]|jgi:hypothetical protein
MADPVGTIVNRLNQLGIPLRSFSDDITAPKDQKLTKIDFTWKADPGGPVNVFRSFINVIIRNAHFAADTILGSRLHPNDACFREVGSSDSLHVIVNSKRGGQVHIDTVSPVLGRDENGFADYDLGKLLQHYAADVKNHPELIVPSGQGGLNFGVRF